MQVLKDLSSEIQKLEAKDKHYRVQATINQLLAPQHATRPFEYKKKGWGEIERVEVRTDGTPTGKRAPTIKTTARQGKSEIKRADCWTFKIIDGKIHLPWGGPWGLFKGALRRSLESQNKLRYDNVKLDLVRVYGAEGKSDEVKLCACGEYTHGCLKLDGPVDSMNDGGIPKVVLETRHTSKGDVMVEVFFDYILNRKIEFFIELDSECPLNEEKFVAIAKSINTLDNFGPSKRGSMSIAGIQEINNN